MKECENYAMKYCAKEERTQRDVLEKLIKKGLTTDEANEVIAKLIKKNYINEQRYAKLFAISKFHQNKWGRIKIGFQLREKGISQRCIAIALKEINEKEYEALCKKLLDDKKEELKNEKDPFIVRKRVYSYLTSKGFETNLVKNLLAKE
jgi:regulatory protein